MNLRHAVHSLLDAEPPSRFARLLRTALAVLILANVSAVVLETVPSIQAHWQAALDRFELVSLVVFLVEYGLRLWAAPEYPQFGGRFGRLRWATSFAAVVDLLAVLPSLLAATGIDLRVVRIARLLRILRIAKLERYSVALQTLHRVLKAKSADLLSLLFLLVILLVVSSTLMFHIEHAAQPNVFSSIPTTMWWGIVTLTTIGYGDMAPITAGGRWLGAVVAVLGIGMFALPAGLLGAAFVDELGKARLRLHHQRDGKPHCPHCGADLPQP